LHSESNKLGKENSLTEKGAVVNGRGDTPNTHDILTGSNLDGTFSSDTTDTTCRNWTSHDTGSALLGHNDRRERTLLLLRLLIACRSPAAASLPALQLRPLSGRGRRRRAALGRQPLPR